MHIVVGLVSDGVMFTPEVGEPELVPEEDFAVYIDELESEADAPRWVWSDTSVWYPRLLDEGVRVARCVDLRLSHAILRNSVLTADTQLAKATAGPWDRPPRQQREPDGALFALVEEEPEPDLDVLAEWELQRTAIAASTDPGRIQRLLAAESAGALVAAEMRFAGMPWRADVHEQLLGELLGPRPAAGERPQKIAELLDTTRELLDVPDLNPDSPAELLKGLAKGGVLATSTRSWELKKIKHPAIAPLLEYKKLSRLASANGWHWVDTWVVDGRFRPDYVVGGVVTGRWATSGGGALQLPKQVRGAAVADDGWKLVVADAAQLEPRILAAMAGDREMVAAGAAGDLYAGIVASGTIDTREHAKVALLGAMYGATQGDGGRLMPQLQRAYPRAISLVEDAARAGERGEIVTTRLGRSSPPPGDTWRSLQADAYGEEATAAAADRARSYARSWGRFTRNFIVQGTAAEWALCWMASLRNRLTELSGDGWFVDGPHLVFFLHDELVVHTPAALAERVSDEIRSAAADAGRLLFGALPVEFPLTVAVVDNYGQAK
ncbi:MAG TPA: bifunctional 3'-5' exonuclease/DNA polymerase [Galbitalea sp.]